jgi:hypothetical protein
MDGVSGWLASITTILAGITVAANLGSRITGWGFVLFTFASLCWALNAGLGGVTSLLAANLAMAFINAFGVWRWLGRQRRIEQGSTAAMERSSQAPVPSLISAGTMLGGPLRLGDGNDFGTVIDLMLRCDQQGLAYAVVGFDGIGGIGELFRAVPASRLHLSRGTTRCSLSEAELRALPELDPTDWPTLPGPAWLVGNRPAGAAL